MLREHLEQHQERNKLTLYFLMHRLWRHIPEPLALDLFARLYHTGAFTQWPVEKAPPKPAEQQGLSKAQLELIELRKLKKKKKPGEEDGPVAYSGNVVANNIFNLAFRVVPIEEVPPTA